MMRRSTLSTLSRPTTTIATLVLALTLAASHYPAPVHAQQPSFQPDPVFQPYYSAVDGKALVVGGGLSSTTPLVQPFTIDLSVSWNTAQPAFSPLTTSPSTTSSSTTSAVSADGRQWLVYNDAGTKVYDLQDNTWTLLFGINSTPTPPSDTMRPESPVAVTDPETGWIYILRSTDGHGSAGSGPGSTDPSMPGLGSSGPGFYTQNPQQQGMMRVSLAKGIYDSIPMDPTLEAANYYAAAWSPLLKQIMVVGGTGSVTDPLTLSVYSDKAGWTKVKTSVSSMGSSPSPSTSLSRPRMGACFASAYRGTKMVLFGGATLDKTTTLGDIAILDVATMTWTVGPEVADKDRRAFAACSVSNDQLIVWGGGQANGLGILNSTLVFDLKTNSWKGSYHAVNSRSSDPSNPSGQSGSPVYNSGQDEHQSSSAGVNVTALVIGLVAAALVLAGLAVILCRKRCCAGRRKAQEQAQQQDRERGQGQGQGQGQGLDQDVDDQELNYLHYYDDDKLAPHSGMASAVSLPPTTSTPTSPTSPLPYTLHPTGIMAPRYTPMADKSTARLIPVASPPYSQVAPGSASSFALARAPAPHSKSVAASSAPQPPQQARIMNGTTPLPAGRPVSDATLVQRLQDYNNTISELETENMTPPHTPTSYVQGGEKMLQELQASPHPRAMLMRRMSTDDNEGMDIYFCNSIPVTSSFFADMETGHLKSDSNSVPPLPTSAAGAAGAASSHWSQGQQYLTPPK